MFQSTAGFLTPFRIHGDLAGDDKTTDRFSALSYPHVIFCRLLPGYSASLFTAVLLWYLAQIQRKGLSRHSAGQVDCRRSGSQSKTEGKCPTTRSRLLSKRTHRILGHGHPPNRAPVPAFILVILALKTGGTSV
jgi:hypothetical protein